MTTFIRHSGYIHYYGDTVRALFLIAAIIMVAGLPTVSGYLHIPTLFSVIGILLLVLSSGFTNPRQQWDAIVNVVVAACGFVVFETYAVQSYADYGVGKFFLSNIVLGFLFLLALYFGVKTVRWLYVK